jgi:hypothetical protein
LFLSNKKNLILEIPLSTGQNIAMGYENWTEVIEGWIEEKEYYYHSFPSTIFFSHYSQVKIINKPIISNLISR